MAKREADAITASFGDSCLRNSDIATLGPREWVNDAVISFYFELLNSVISQAQAEGECPLYMPWAVGMMVDLAGDAGHDVRSLLPPLDANLLLLPINDSFGHGPPDRPNGGSHWSTVILKRETDGLQATKVESLGASNDAAAQTVIKAFEVIQGHHVKLADDVQVRQVNGWDCGIYVLIVASRLVDTALASESQPIDYESMTPGAVTDFRTNLHQWLSKWADTLKGTERYQSLTQVEARLGNMPK